MAKNKYGSFWWDVDVQLFKKKSAEMQGISIQNNIFWSF